MSLSLGLFAVMHKWRTGEKKSSEESACTACAAPLICWACAKFSHEWLPHTEHFTPSSFISPPHTLSFPCNSSQSMLPIDPRGGVFFLRVVTETLWTKSLDVWQTNHWQNCYTPTNSHNCIEWLWKEKENIEIYCLKWLACNLLI